MVAGGVLRGVNGCAGVLKPRGRQWRGLDGAWWALAWRAGGVAPVVVGALGWHAGSAVAGLDGVWWALAWHVGVMAPVVVGALGWHAGSAVAGLDGTWWVLAWRVGVVVPVVVGALGWRAGSVVARSCMPHWCGVKASGDGSGVLRAIRGQRGVKLEEAGSWAPGCGGVVAGCGGGLHAWWEEKKKNPIIPPLDEFFLSRHTHRVATSPPSCILDTATVPIHTTTIPVWSVWPPLPWPMQDAADGPSRIYHHTTQGRRPHPVCSEHRLYKPPPPSLGPNTPAAIPRHTHHEEVADDELGFGPADKISHAVHPPPCLASPPHRLATCKTGQRRHAVPSNRGRPSTHIRLAQVPQRSKNPGLLSTHLLATTPLVAMPPPPPTWLKAYGN
ncbi:hypothetical protein H4582DRAFT_2064580 [Lactarius indigo]|nr:hypothetical protein H4582DRAFT_2064580 [Lactarius indigo]